MEAEEAVAEAAVVVAEAAVVVAVAAVAAAAWWPATAMAAVTAVVAAAEVATDLTAHLGGHLTVNWQWRLIGLWMIWEMKIILIK